MWATYRQHPIRRASLPQVATNDGIAVPYEQRDSLRMVNRRHHSAKGSHRIASRRQRLGNRRHRNTKGNHRIPNPRQRFANQPQRMANGSQRNGNRGQRNANVRQFGSKHPHFHSKAAQKAFAALLLRPSAANRMPPDARFAAEGHRGREAEIWIL